MSVSLKIQIENAAVLSAIKGLVDLGHNMRPIMRGIATIGENSTRERFASETGPDGERWPASIRVQLSGGKTLTDSGRLGDSITSDYGSDFAEWGTNSIYGAMQNFGGVIKPKSANALRFKIAGGGFATVKSVTIPARPFLGIDADDEQDISDFITRKIKERLN